MCEHSRPPFEEATKACWNRTNLAESDRGPQPIGTREKIRAKGPTVHPHFGKQAMDGAGNHLGHHLGAEGAE